MDGLSAAGSAMAVVSLAAQLNAGIKQLYDFWSSVKDAPKEVATVLTDLKLLSLVLEEIRLNQLMDQTPVPVLSVVLESCVDKVEMLKGIVGNLDLQCQGTGRRLRKWGALKACFQNDKLVKFRTSLEETKTTLLLAQQRLGYMIQIGRQRHLAITQAKQVATENSTASSYPPATKELFEQMKREILRTAGESIPNRVIRTGAIKSIDHAIRQLVDGQAEESIEKDQNNNEGRVSISTPKREIQSLKKAYFRGGHTALTTPFGVIHLSWKTYTVHRHHSWDPTTTYVSRIEYQTEAKFRLHPAQWLLRYGIACGINAAIHRSTAGWQYILETYRAVPDDSLIFTFCEEGNVEGVRTLLAKGCASVHDVDSSSRTPLHFAAIGGAIDVCRLLLASGANANAEAVSDKGWYTILPLRIPRLALLPALESGIEEVVRLFLDNTDMEVSDFFLADQVEGWELLCGRPGKRRTMAALVSILRHWRPDLIETTNGTVKELLSVPVPAEDIEGLELVVKVIQDTGLEPEKSVNGYGSHVPSRSFAFCIERRGYMFLGLVSRSYPPAKKLLEEYFPQLLHQEINGRTMTSRVINNSFTFSAWRYFIDSYLNLDFKEFVRQEIEETASLRASGWTEETLLDLFFHDYEPLYNDRPCTMCRREVYILKERWWDERVELIKERHFWESTGQAAAGNFWAVASSRKDSFTRHNPDHGRGDFEKPMLCQDCWNLKYNRYESSDDFDKDDNEDLKISGSWDPKYNETQ